MVRWALMYPDAYEVGLPNQGLQILYEVLNERDGTLAERTYAVFPDMEKVMRDHAIPQFTVDGHRPVGDFDLLGVSFATELGYTNLLTALDLAGIPLHSRRPHRRRPDRAWRAGTRRSTPSRSPTSSTPRCSATARRSCSRSPRSCASGRPRAGPAGATGCCCGWPPPAGSTCPRFYDVDYLPDGRIRAVVPNRDGVPWRVHKHTVMDLDSWPYPKNPLVPLAETVHERYSVEIFRGCTRGCRFCQAGMITRPVTRAQHHRHRRHGRARHPAAPASTRWGCSACSSADHSEIGEVAKGLADRYEGTNISLSLPSTRVDAFNVTLANELSRNGRRSGLTFAPEGGSERMRKVINKMVTEDDLIQTVAAAYSSGWRQVKLYFMCGLPTETDDDVMQIGDARQAGDRRPAARCPDAATSGARCRSAGSCPSRTRRSSGPSSSTTRRPTRGWRGCASRCASDKQYGRAIGFRYHDGRPGTIEGLLSRGDRRVGRVIEAVWRDGGRFDGWSEHFSYERWADACERRWPTSRSTSTGTPPASATSTRCCPGTTSTPASTATGCGRTGRTPLDPDGAREVEDCRWTPCYDCGVCPEMGTEIQMGPTGQQLLPLSVRCNPDRHPSWARARVPAHHSKPSCWSPISRRRFDASDSPRHAALCEVGHVRAGHTRGRRGGGKL